MQYSIIQKSQKKKGFLIYLIDNCLKDYKALKKVNTELNEGMRLSSNTDINYLGILNRCVQGYLIIEVASLFDPNKKAISLYKILDKNYVDNIKQSDIIKKIIKNRHKFDAHHDFKYLDSGKFGLNTYDIMNSDLNKILANCKNLVQNV